MVLPSVVLRIVVGPQVASAIDRGQVFSAVVNNAYQNYDKKFKPTTALIYLASGSYMLEKGQPAIEIPRVPVEIHQHTSQERNSFKFTRDSRGGHS